MKTTTHHRTTKTHAAKTSSGNGDSLPAKVSTKVTTKSAVQHHKPGNEALGFLDEATSLLRTGLREGAETTEEARITAKRKAHDLLGKASKSLSKAIEGGASTLQDFIKKI